MKVLCVAAASALLGINAAFVPLVGQTPTKLEQIPVYAGAARQPALEAEAAESLAAPTPGVYALVSKTVRIYRVNAGLEDVVRFYQQRLHSWEIRTDQDRDRKMAEEEHVPVGQATSVSLEASVVDLSPEAFEDESEVPWGLAGVGGVQLGLQTQRQRGTRVPDQSGRHRGL